MIITPSAGSDLRGLWVEVPTSMTLRCLAYIVWQNQSLLGAYFFATANADPDVVARLTPADAFYMGQTGYLGIVGGEWPVLATTPLKREDWPLPTFSRGELNAAGQTVHVALLVDEDLETELARTPITEEEAAQLPVHGSSMGHQYAEIALARMIDSGPVPYGMRPWWPSHFKIPPKTVPRETAYDPDQPYGLRIAIPTTWNGRVELLIRRLTKQLGHLGEVDGWEASDTSTSVFTYSHDRDLLLKTAQEASRKAKLPPETRLILTSPSGQPTEFSISDS